MLEAAAKPGVPDDLRALLRRRVLEFPSPKAATVVLDRSPRLLHPVEATLVRGPKDGRDPRSPDVGLPALGILAFTLQPGNEKEAELRIRRPRALQPEPPVPVLISRLRGPEDLSEGVVTSLAAEEGVRSAGKWRIEAKSFGGEDCGSLSALAAPRVGWRGGHERGERAG